MRALRNLEQRVRYVSFGQDIGQPVAFTLYDVV